MPDYAPDYDDIHWHGSAVAADAVPAVVRDAITKAYPSIDLAQVRWHQLPAVKRNAVMYVGDRVDKLGDRTFPVSLQVAMPEQSAVDAAGQMWRFGKLFGVFHVSGGTVSVVAFAPVHTRANEGAE